MLGHLQGPSGRHWGATTPSICDTEDFHGLPLWPPFPVSAQHGGIHTLTRWVNIIPRRQVLVFTARIPLFPIQKQIIDHLFLVFLLASQFSVQPLAVSEAAQRRHAFQNVRVQLAIGRQATHGYSAAWGWLQARVWFVFPAPGIVEKRLSS